MSTYYRRGVGTALPRTVVKCSGRGCTHVQRIYVALGRTGWKCVVCGKVNML